MELQKICFRNQKENIDFVFHHSQLRNTQGQKIPQVRHHIVGLEGRLNKALVLPEKVQIVEQQKRDCEA